MPTVVAGFEPIDVLMAVYMIVKQQSEGDARLENEYPRVVKPEGNPKALALMKEAFKVTSGNWRGIGSLPNSALQLRESLADFDARLKHDVHVEQGKDIITGCQCHLVIIGKIKPDQCPMFLKACTPRNPSAHAWSAAKAPAGSGQKMLLYKPKTDCNPSLLSAF